MQRRPLGRTGFSVSPLGFGAAPIGLLKVDQMRIAQILNQLLDAGMNLIDTAAGYAGSEEAIGLTVGSRRKQYVLVSKCGSSFEDLPGKAWSAQLVWATVDRSLKRLKTDYIDVMLLHSCDIAVLEAGEALGALAKARDAGKIRFAGYSGDNAAVAYATTLADVAVVETSINLVDQVNIDSLLPRARERGIGVIAKRPIANAAWRPIEAQAGFYQDYARPYHQRFAAMGLRLADFVADHIADWTELALRFTLSQPGVSTAIVGTTNPKNAVRNVELATKPPLSEKSIKIIRDAFAQAQKNVGEAWPALT